MGIKLIQGYPSKTNVIGRLRKKPAIIEWFFFDKNR
jgi:hypothetical protein